MLPLIWPRIESFFSGLLPNVPLLTIPIVYLTFGFFVFPKANTFQSIIQTSKQRGTLLALVVLALVFTTYVFGELHRTIYHNKIKINVNINDENIIDIKSDD